MEDDRIMYTLNEVSKWDLDSNQDSWAIYKETRHSNNLRAAWVLDELEHDKLGIMTDRGYDFMWKAEMDYINSVAYEKDLRQIGIL